MEKNDLTRFGVAMSQALVDEFDGWCQTVGYDNRSEAIRDLVRKAIISPDGLQADQLVAGTIVMVYDHHSNDLSANLTSLQHEYHHDIVSTMHIHLNHHQCLEIIVVRGTYERLKQLCHRIQVQKGVLYSQLSVTHIDPENGDRHDERQLCGDDEAEAAKSNRAEGIMFDVVREKAFDQLAESWREIAEGANPDQVKQLIQRLNVTDKVVLDVGTGTGVLVAEGLRANPERWVACDLSTHMLNILRSEHEDRKLQLLHADVHQLPLESGEVDVVICHQSFPHFHSPRIALTELFRVLKTGGTFVINHFVGRQFVNRVHCAANEQILQQDVLHPAEQVCRWMQEIGFVVTELIDEEQRYYIHAVKPIVLS